MNKLITELTESISYKLKDIEGLTKMINLATTHDVKGMRRFIYDNDTSEKEMFYQYLQWGDPQMFAKVYPNAKKQKGKYAIEIIYDQYETDKKFEREKHGLDFEDGYPIDYSDAEFPDWADMSDPTEVAANMTDREKSA
jgi:hypothetical protein